MKAYEVHRLTRDSDLTATERAVLREVAMYASGDEGQCYASQATLASDTGLAERTVRRDLAELERLGVLVVVPDRTRRCTVYRVDAHLIPAPGAREPAPRATGTTCRVTGTEEGADRHHVPDRPAPRADDPSGIRQGSDPPPPNPPPSGGPADLAGWVADRFVAELDELLEADDGEERLRLALDRGRERDRRLVDNVQRAARTGLGRWAGAPDGLRRRWIADGIALACARLTARDRGPRLGTTATTSPTLQPEEAAWQR